MANKIKRYVALLQYKNEQRGAEIMEALPKNEKELRAIKMVLCEQAGMPFESAIAEIFVVDERAVDVIADWTNWKVSIEEVYKVCLDSWLIKANELGFAQTTTFDNYVEIKPKDNDARHQLN